MKIISSKLDELRKARSEREEEIKRNREQQDRESQEYTEAEYAVTQPRNWRSFQKEAIESRVVDRSVKIFRKSIL